MKHWQHIRKRAEEVRRTIFPEPEAINLLLDGETILTRLDAMTGIEREKARRLHPALQNSHAVINPDYYSLVYNGELPAWFAIYCQAHEYAHYFLHNGASHCSSEDISLSFSEDSVPVGENRVVGYSPHERKEREANLFARELLLPSTLLRRLFTQENWRARDISLKTGLPFDFVCQQLAYALLISDSVQSTDALIHSDEEIQKTDQVFKLDESQKRAAHSEKQRLLIEAGPGTGKTRTLVGRILYLLKKGIDPKNILALTFSNKAAEEMRERIALYAPEAAAQIWLGTFHAFGLETLRKYAVESGFTEGFQLLDSIDAQILLENHLLELNLEHYRNLPFPTTNLKSIYAGISRAKDEMITAEKYENAARGMLKLAVDEESILAAQKALEVSRIYSFYERLLRENNWLDFGDLIFRTVELIKSQGPVKRELQNRFSHVLVDEFQDVNRASGILVREIAGEKGNLWVVGDARQTIYRWRGASSLNLKLFESDFPDAESLALNTNYRSVKPVVDLLNEIAPAVAKSHSFLGWQLPETNSGDNSANTSDYAAIRYAQTKDFSAEAEFLAKQINLQKKAGRLFKEQAVLGRSNGILSKVADELTSRGIPVLYLGNMFERAEIRDLLSLLSLTTANSGRHLLRLTKIFEYNLNTEEVKRLVSAADTQAEAEFPAALSLAETDFALSDEFKDKIALFQSHLRDITEETSAWQFFSAYLFDRSNYLLPILSDHSVAGRQKRFAIYQLLQFAISETGKNSAVRLTEANPRKSFLRLVRHLAASGEESAFRKLPSWAEGIDAVRLLTVHAAKGLEFPVVFLPYLGNAYFPSKKQKEDCPLPHGLIEIAEDKSAEHEAEELCLFFVALSRAKQNLVISCSKQYGRPSKPSRFLSLIKESLPAPEQFDASESAKETSGLPDIFIELDDQSSNNLYTFNELRTYINCPRRYFYEYILRMRGSHDEAAYLQFHACVQEVIFWIKKSKAEDAVPQPDLESAIGKLTEIWQTKQIHSHAYAPVYFAEASKLVERALEFFSSVTINESDSLRPVLELNLAGGRVMITPDLLEVSADKRSVQAHKIKTGRAKKEADDLGDDEKLMLAALHQALADTYPEAEIQAVFNYISSGEFFAYNPKNIKTQLNHLSTAIEGVRSRKFSAKVNSHNCPSCAHYFICPGGDL